MNALNRLAPHAHWLLRIALASIFLFHGLTKFPNLGGLAEMMGMPVFAVALVALMETAGGALILVGGFGVDWATRVSGLLIAPVMLGAIAMVHWGQWGFAATETHPMGGMEFQFTLLMLALYFLIVGNGMPEDERARAGQRASAPTRRTAVDA